jgi:cell division protein FtsL
MIQPQRHDRKVRIGNPRAVRAATQRRKARKARSRYVGVTRTLGLLTAVMVLLMSYVVLTSSLTGLSYAVAKAQANREALQEETMRLDDRIAALRSDDRLSQLAARLGMTEPARLAVVRIAVPRVARARPSFPVLSSLAGFFAPAVARQQ